MLVVMGQPIGTGNGSGMPVGVTLHIDD